MCAYVEGLKEELDVHPFSERNLRTSVRDELVAGEDSCGQIKSKEILPRDHEVRESNVSQTCLIRICFQTFPGQRAANGPSPEVTNSHDWGLTTLCSRCHYLDVRRIWFAVLTPCLRPACTVVLQLLIANMDVLHVVSQSRGSSGVATCPTSSLDCQLRIGRSLKQA